ncbi:MAG: hypothetical protein KDD66_03250 [Bdellovibrionales bacterium]|nr:hypothetical protein [Bdellovibrionales bacterium]
MKRCSTAFILITLLVGATNAAATSPAAPAADCDHKEIESITQKQLDTFGDTDDREVPSVGDKVYYCNPDDDCRRLHNIEWSEITFEWELDAFGRHYANCSICSGGVSACNCSQP